MTLDNRITKDLTELYNNGAINGVIYVAKNLNLEIKSGVSTKGLSGHFSVNWAAKTVFVTQNPGQDVAISNKNLKERQINSDILKELAVAGSITISCETEDEDMIFKDVEQDGLQKYSLKYYEGYYSEHQATLGEKLKHRQLTSLKHCEGYSC